MKPIFGSYTKAVWQAIGAILTAVLPMLLTEDAFGAEQLINTVIVGAGAFLVWNTANVSDWVYGKAVASGIIAAATLLLTLLVGGVTTSEIIQVVVAGVTTALVLLFPNTRAGVRGGRSPYDAGPRSV